MFIDVCYYNSTKGFSYLGLVLMTLVHRRRGISPPFFILQRRVKLANHYLSVFIDESGDFGEFEKHAPYYIVSMVLHDQRVDINNNIQEFDRHLQELNIKEHSVHVGPLIRRESNEYKYLKIEERKKIFNALFHFARKVDFKYFYVIVPKHECKDIIELHSKVSRLISDKIKDNLSFFEDFNKKIIYYDNGQVELTKIITSVFNTLFVDVEFRKVMPIDYKLFQVADLICTLMLLKEKGGCFTKSEIQFFKSEREFKKNYLKHIENKLI